MKIKINKKLYDKVYLPLFDKEQRTQIYYGGGSSGKSFTFMNYALLWALEGRSVLVVRKVAATLRHSVWSECMVALEALNLMQYFDINKTDRTIISKVSNGCVMFRGIDDPEKIKSIRSPRNGAIDTILCDEATELYADDITQLKIRQRGYSKFPKRIILLFNPIHTQHHLYKSYFSDKDEYDDYYEDDQLVIRRVTYKDNTHLAPEDIATLEDLKDTSPLHYAVYCLGLWGTLGDKIFKNIEVISEDMVPKNIPLYAGVDWGWNDPTAYVMVGFDNKVIYILKELVQSKLDYRDLINSVDPRVHTTGDSEDPRSIDQLKQMGMNIRGAVKGQGSVMGGLMWMMRHPIKIVDTCPTTIHAFQNYAWKKDKRTGESIDEPEHQFSHPVDAVRYALEKFSRGGTGVVGAKVKF